LCLFVSQARSVHCVPRDWVEADPDLNKLIWSDAGASGKPGSLWAVGTLQTLVASLGHASPGSKSWRFKRTRFTVRSCLLVPARACSCLLVPARACSCERSHG
jgi:hypothetical protein